MGALHSASSYRSSWRSSFLSEKQKQKTDFAFPLGMEAVIFVGGVSLGQPATSIPIAAIVGIICGIIIGFFIYEFASRTSKSFNLINNQINEYSKKVFFFFLFLPVPLISFKYLPRCHNQLTSPHWSRSIQQGRGFLWGSRVRHPRWFKYRRYRWRWSRNLPR